MPDEQKPNPVAPGPYNDFVFRRLLDEVHLLLDFVSSRSDRSLDALTGIRVPKREAESVPSQSPDEIIEHVSTLRFPPQGTASNVARDAAFLIVVKDRLNRLARPANGATVAYTALVIGSDQEPMNEVDASLPRAQRKTTRYSLAADAYPGLRRPARNLSRSLKAGILGLILLTTLTVITSGAVAYGRSLLDQLGQAQQRYATVEAIIRDIDPAPPAAAAPPRALVGTGAALANAAAPGEGPFVRYCDRARLLAEKAPGIRTFDDLRQSKLCGELWSADVEIQGAKHRIRSFREVFDAPWKGLAAIRQRLFPDASGPVEPMAATEARCGHTTLAAGSAAGGEGQPAPASLLARMDCEAYHSQNRPELGASDLIAALSNYALPFFFTLLGAGVSILRDLYNRVRESTLASRDLPLSFGRMVLGMVAGAAIGLLYSPTSGHAPAVSTQGLAFLAGYAVDMAFRWLDRRVETVFNADAAVRPVNAARSPAPATLGQATPEPAGTPPPREMPAGQAVAGLAGG
jgi:hypothetical protein